MVQIQFKNFLTTKYNVYAFSKYNQEVTCVTDPIKSTCGDMASAFVNRLIIATYQPLVTLQIPSCVLTGGNMTISVGKNLECMKICNI